MHPKVSVQFYAPKIIFALMTAFLAPPVAQAAPNLCARVFLAPAAHLNRTQLVDELARLRLDVTRLSQVDPAMGRLAYSEYQTKLAEIISVGADRTALNHAVTERMAALEGPRHQAEDSARERVERVRQNEADRLKPLRIQADFPEIMNGRDYTASADGTKIYFARREQIFAKDVATGAEVAIYEAVKRKNETGLWISANSKYMALHSEKAFDHSIEIVSLKKQKRIAKFSGRLAEFSPDEKSIAIFNRDGVTLYYLKSETVLAKIAHETPEGTKGILSFKFVGDGNQIAMVYSRFVRLWNLNNKSFSDIKVADGFSNVAFRAALGRGLGRLVSRNSTNHDLLIRELTLDPASNAAPTGQVLADVPERIRSIDLSPNGQLAVAQTSTDLLVIWDVASGEVLTRESSAKDGYEGRAIFSDDGSKVISWGAEADENERTIRVFDVVGPAAPNRP